MLRLPKWLMGTNQQLQNANRFVDLLGGFTQESYDLALSDDSKASEASTRNVVHSISHSDAVPDAEKSHERVSADAQILVGAVTETTDRTLAATLYHVLANKAIHDRLLTELRTVKPKAASPLPSSQC